MANRRQKPASALQGRGSQHKGTSAVTLTPDAARRVPTPPKGLTRDAVAVWRSFWRSPLGGAVDYAGDGPALRRWITLVSNRDALLAQFGPGEWDEPLTVMGSTGQTVLNPLLKFEERLSREIMQYEDRFGMTPLGRMRLGIAIGQAAESLDGLRKRLTSTPPKRADVAPGEDGIIDLDGLA